MPHDIVLSIAIIWMAILLAISLILVIAGPSLLEQILAFDMATMMILGGLLLLALARDSSFDLDAGLMLALFSFGGTMAATRYYRKGTIFS